MPSRNRKPSNRRSKKRRPATVRSGLQLYPAPYHVPLNMAVPMQFRNLILVTASGGGVVDGTIPCAPESVLAAPFPAASLFPEYSSISTLYSHIKCIQLEITFMPCTSDEVKGDATIGLVISGNLMRNGAPGSYAGAVDNGDSQSWNPVLDVSGRGRYHAIKHRPSLQWNVSTTTGNTVNYSGCPGGIAMFGSGFLPSTAVFTALVVGSYLVSSRS